MVSRLGHGGRAAIDREVGSDDGGGSGALLCAADDYQMGELYPAYAKNSSQYRTSQEVAGTSGVRCGARNGSSNRASPQRPVCAFDGQASTQLEVSTKGAQPRPA